MQVIRSGIELLGHLNTFLLAICKYLIIVIVAVIAIILIAAVVYRYGLNSAISWAEEASKYLMVWLTFLGTPIALRNFAHINIDLLYKILPSRLQQLFYFIVSSIIFLTMAIILSKGLSFASMGARQVASSFNLSMWYMYIAVPLGAGLTMLVALEQGLRSLVGVVDPDRGLLIPDADADAAV